MEEKYFQRCKNYYHIVNVKRQLNSVVSLCGRKLNDERKMLKKIPVLEISYTYTLSHLFK